MVDLEPQIVAAIVGNPDPKAAARHILQLPRIRNALFYLDQRESMGVPLAAPFNAKAGDDAR